LTLLVIVTTVLRSSAACDYVLLVLDWFHLVGLSASDGIVSDWCTWRTGELGGLLFRENLRPYCRCTWAAVCVGL